MVDLFFAWWPVLVLFQLPNVANVVANVLAARVRSRLDHAIPDHLPLTSHQWLVGRLVALGLPVTTIVTSGDAARYHDHQRIIELGEANAFKRDPVYWSAAAHELGHAMFRLGSPRLLRLVRLAAVLAHAAVALAIGLTVAFVMLDLPGTRTPAFACWSAAAALGSVVLVEELVATRLGLRELRAVLGPRDYRAARLDLVAAYATYLAKVGGRAVLLTQWAVLDTIVVERGTLTSLGLAAAALTTVGTVVWILVGLLRLVRPTVELANHLGGVRVALPSILGFLSTIAFIALVWDQGRSPAYAWLVVLAFTATWRLWIVFAELPFLPALLGLERLLRPLRGDGVEVTPEYRAAHRDGRELLLRGNRERVGIAAEARDGALRPLQLLGVFVLPLVVAFWW